MALPSRAKQIEEIAKFLDSDRNEGRELEDIAADIVDAFHDLLGSGAKAPALVPHVGIAFNHPSLSGVWYVAHETPDGRLWIISASTRYGALLTPGMAFWGYARESKDNRKPKPGEALKPRPGSPGQNPDWRVGDTLSTGQRAYSFVVRQTGDKCVLLQDTLSDDFRVESNDSMERFYHRETNVRDDDWSV
jgi:hypothetical protein